MLRSAASCASWILTIVCCFNGVLRAADGDAGRKHTLRYKFAEGATLHYVVSNETSIQVQVGATSDVVQHASESGRVLRTVAVNPDGSAALEVMIEYVSLSAGDGAIEWDSRSGEPAPAQFTGIEKTIGTPLMTVTISADGTIVRAQRGNTLADESQLDSPEFDMLPMLPAEPIAIGESWTERFEVGVMTELKLKRPISMQREYTLRSVENGVAEIGVRTSVLTPIEDPREQGQLIQRIQSGSFRLDIAQGQLRERVMKLDNKVVGFEGPHTALRVVGTRQESLGSAEKTAARPGSKSAQ